MYILYTNVDLYCIFILLGNFKYEKRLCDAKTNDPVTVRKRKRNGRTLAVFTLLILLIILSSRRIFIDEAKIRGHNRSIIRTKPRRIGTGLYNNLQQL